MHLERMRIEPTLEYFVRRELLSRREPDQIASMLSEEFELSEAVSFAQSIHVHLKVDDLKELPHDEMARRGVLVWWKNPGYVKYEFPGSINIIFSTFPIAQDDIINGAVALSKPFVDHLGVDMRSETIATRVAFDGVVNSGKQLGWRQVHQGGPGNPVYGGHTQVLEKNWMYPPEGPAGWRRPTEFAFGPLKVSDDYLGCDHRPIDPAHPLAELALPWRDSARSCNPTSTADEAIMVYVTRKEDRYAAERLFSQVQDAPSCCGMRAEILDGSKPETIPPVVVAVWRLKDTCPIPLTVVDGFPVVMK
jgi:hypothetical protein